MEKASGVSTTSLDHLPNDDEVLCHPEICRAASPEPGGAWQRDVTLEMWVNLERDPVRIRLEGTLDHSTSGMLVSLVRELIADGVRNFEFDSAEDTSEADRLAKLVRLQELEHGSSIRFTWSGGSPGG